MVMLDLLTLFRQAWIITGLNVINSGNTRTQTRINEPAWQEHWIGKNADYQFNKATDAFAGATISPSAVYNASMRALKACKVEVIK